MTDNVFEGMVKRYDTPARVELTNIILEQIKLEFKNAKNSSLLDYGSGTGLISLEIADLVESMVLIDSAEQMLQVAEGKIESRGLSNARALHADYTQEFLELEADIIFVSLVLLHVPDTNKLLENLYRVLNDDGKLIIVDFDKNPMVDHPRIHNGFTHEEMEGYLSEVGFKPVKTETSHHGEKIFAKQDASMFMSASVK